MHILPNFIRPNRVYHSALLLLTIVLFAVSRPVAAQDVARVAAKERITEKRNLDSDPWAKAEVGDGLAINSHFRTRKRSKADLLFVDKSLIRLGELSTLTVESATDSHLTSGELLFSRLTPGRIVAGAGIAGIKGSSGTIILNRDGSALFTLYSGAMDVDTVRGQNVVVPPGHSVLVTADGSLQALRVAAPLISGQGTGTGTGYDSGDTGTGEGTDLGAAPVDSPYAGSAANLAVRASPIQVATNESGTAGNSVVAQNPYPFQKPAAGASGALPVPPITVFPLAFKNFHLDSIRANTMDAAPTTGPGPTSGTGVPIGPLAAIALDEAPAIEHMDFLSANGKVSGETDFEAIGAMGHDGTRAYGGIFHTAWTDGRWTADLGLLPLTLHYNGASGGVTRDLSTFSSASVTYAESSGDFQVGRQRFLEGPTQVALFGSLVRQGDRDTMDAVRYSPNLGDKTHLTLAYLEDAFPHNLPYDVPGNQTGYFARLGHETKVVNLGFNLLHYDNLPVSTTTGASFDYALAVVPDELEFYGEEGRDPFRRGINTAGLTFPGLYDRTDFDVYFETATMTREGTSAPIPPTEYAVRVYRKIGANSNLVAEFEDFYHADTSLTVALSLGARFPINPR